MNTEINNKHIGIITINDNTNYGNRLQNYALTTILSQYGTVDTIRCYANDDEPNVCIDIRNRFITAIKCCAPGIRGLTGHRERNFQRFTDELVPDNRASVSSHRGLVPKNAHYDCIVVGSDQVWNDRYASAKGLRLRLASFVHDNTTVISYAASFGVNHVKAESEAAFHELLPRFSTISVREDRAVELVKELGNQHATLVLDPTLMLTPVQWRSITSDTVKNDDRFILTYFLGTVTEDQQDIINDYAKRHRCRVRSIYSYYTFSSDVENYPAGPREFVELFSKAQYVFTDSYHACCFSIIFNKNFKVFGRNGLSAKDNMNSRMETLFRLFELGKAFTAPEEESVIDYAHVNHLLKEYQKQSAQWLSAALN
ncbi:polysaccharide pyruvyl transferase family protein [Bifidobacterium reuteri]|uniref:Polysaccharide pyruvyl transferase family protein n=1 Tax=Bifidobacterium reuteri TaxID=983706 RepID=A0A5J5E7A5_9BIFI|nr:polysaccharide pyruvyl transferase family protein [Bifidobacterium reuteri]KAA8824907.1 polysaccharide pyruvyl transferase family protein [Bifidobacterium reuteri]